MPQIKEFTATNTFHTDDKGYSAFETLGRRVGGQYDQAGNDLRDIGRVKSNVTAMIGRWPFNLIELEQRAAKKASQSTSSEGGGVNILRGQSGGGSRRSPGRGPFEQMSEGAGAFGRFANSLVGGEGTVTTSDRDGYSQQVLKERDRQARLDELASQKRWDAYQKSLDKYNTTIETDAQKAADSYTKAGAYGADYGGTGEPATYTPDTGSDYGGGSFDWTFGLSNLFSSDSGTATSDTATDFNPSY